MSLDKMVINDHSPWKGRPITDRTVHLVRRRHLDLQRTRGALCRSPLG
jgi:hypothetical protein